MRSRSITPQKRRYASRSRSASYSNASYSGSRSARSYSRSYSKSLSKSPRYRRSTSRTPPRRGRPIESRENPEPSSCIGVFGLSLNTEERDLYRAFQKYGEIKDVQLVLDNYTGRSRGFGFIYYESVDSAGRAKKEAHGMEIDGKQVRVDFSITRKPHTPTPGVYLGKKSTRHEYGYYDDRGSYERRSRSGYRYRSRSPGRRTRSRSYHRRHY